jgi:hypothetical protein
MTPKEFEVLRVGDPARESCGVQRRGVSHLVFGYHSTPRVLLVKLPAMPFRFNTIGLGKSTGPVRRSLQSAFYDWTIYSFGTDVSILDASRRGEFECGSITEPNLRK